MKRKEPTPPRHFGPVAVAVDEFLRGLGCTDITFIKSKHVKVTANVGPRRIIFSIPCTPRDDTSAAKQAVRLAKKKLAEACVAVA